jgi:alpha-methylacyl-CoA racemase
VLSTPGKEKPLPSHSKSAPRKSGPLVGTRIVEFAGIGPAPFACMLLADMGAEIVCIERPGKAPRDHLDILKRGRTWVELDLKRPGAVEDALALIETADILIEGFRPGVMERIGLGPDSALARNPALVYGRMTGWGQSGPLAQTAGHDIDYIAITGALDSIRAPGGGPVPPLNLVGDFGGGALYLATGVLAAVIEARRSGAGQVVDCAMCDGVTTMLSMFHSFTARGVWHDEPGTNLLDGGAHFYGTYECADGRYIAVGAIEPQFYDLFRRIAGLDDPAFDAQRDRAGWPALKAKVAAIFKTRTRDEWTALFDGTDACVAPVLSLAEAPEHPHLAARGAFIERDGLRQAAPAPRFSRTESCAGEVTVDDLGDPRAIAAQWAARTRG